MARSTFTRSVQKRVHRRLWSFFGTERIKIGSVPTFFFLFWRVNARPFFGTDKRRFFPEFVVVLRQLFNLDPIAFYAPQSALHLRGNMAGKKKKAEPRKAATKVVGPWKLWSRDAAWYVLLKTLPWVIGYIVIVLEVRLPFFRRDTKIVRIHPLSFEVRSEAHAD